jgi:hypothetical protein
MIAFKPVQTMSITTSPWIFYLADSGSLDERVPGIGIAVHESPAIRLDLKTAANVRVDGDHQVNRRFGICVDQIFA